MSCDFDRLLPRRGTNCSKWDSYDEDVLPMYVADMDFRSPEPVIEALRQEVERGLFGYPKEPPELRPVLVERLHKLYGWDVSPEAIIFVAGVVVGFNIACQAVGQPGDGILLQTPIYFPMLAAPKHAGMTGDEMELTRCADGRYEVDMDLMARTITPRTRVFLLCNPHNPVGRVYRREELQAMAELCLRNDVVICSDEIHGDLIFSGHRHVPIATLSPEVAQRTITLMAPSKTFNIPGLHCSFAIIENPELRDAYRAAFHGIVSSLGQMGYAAALAAYRDGQRWLDELLAYLEGNRELVLDYVAAHLPGIHVARPEGTYLAWLDCRAASLPDTPFKFFLERARVAMNDGATFGRGGEGYVRLNFGCCRDMLLDALGRMRQAFLSR
jgi:cystathionine beta-lyase